MHLTTCLVVECIVHTAVTNGRWCGGERPECGPGGRAVKII